MEGGENIGGLDQKNNSDECSDDDTDDDTNAPKQKIQIRLGDGKVRELQSMSSTYFYVDGKPISAQDFLKRLFDGIQLLELLESEERLRELWADPITRKDLLKKLESAGCDKNNLRELQRLIGAEKSDLLDVLAYIAYARPPISRATRAEARKKYIYYHLNDNEQDFVAYMLRHYIAIGTDELDMSKLSTVVTAKYGSLDAAKQQLGELNEIRRTFVEFQQKLYA